jgi:uncharacterized protein (DUF1800 family)
MFYLNTKIPFDFTIRSALYSSIFGTALLIAGCGTSENLTTGASTQPATIESGAQVASINPSSSSSSSSSSDSGLASASQKGLQDGPATEKDAFRLLQQASFGPSEKEIETVMSKGVRGWLQAQFSMPSNNYSGRDRDNIGKWDTMFGYDYCSSLPAQSIERAVCGDQFLSSSPVRRDFFKQATMSPNQLRQRVTFALSQILVVSEVDLPHAGTYGMADYYQTLHDNSFGTYSDLLKAVTLHPLMGTYLGMVNNYKESPNENYGRELLQLFTLGTCDLNMDGSIKGGACNPTYDNKTVREYAYTLTGYTYPKGGVLPGGVTSLYDLNAVYYKGSMLPVESRRDVSPRSLLSGVQVPAGTTPEQALSLVIKSIEMHPNFAPFISKQLIQFLVTSNPSAAYVERVATAFKAGVYQGFGSGKLGDLKAAVAAILMDDEARSEANDIQISGKLKDPILKMVSAIRAFNGVSDGEEMGVSFQSAGLSIGQPFLNSPTVFNFYRPEFNLPTVKGKSAPQFQLITPNSVMGWINVVDDLLYGWDLNAKGLAPRAGITSAIGTKLDFSSFEADAVDSEKLFNRLNKILTGGDLGASEKSVIVRAMDAIKPTFPVPDGSTWQREKVKVGAFLVLSSSNFQIQR